MGQSEITLAIVGAGAPLAQPLLDELDTSSLPIGQLRLLDDESHHGETLSWKDGRARIEWIDEAELPPATLVLVIASNPQWVEALQRWAESGCMLLDASGEHAADEGIPLVAPQINPGSLGAACGGNRVSLADSLAIALATITQPLLPLGLDRVDATVLLSAAGAGPDAVAELARQTTFLLNGKPLPKTQSGQQLAFNMVPAAEPVEQNGYCRRELILARQLQRVLGDDRLQVNTTLLRTPVFHGDALQLMLQFESEPGVEALKNSLAEVPAIALIEGAEYPTAVGQAIGDDRVWLGRLHEDLHDPRLLHLWAVVDNQRKGFVLSLVQTAEILVKEYL